LPPKIFNGLKTTLNKENAEKYDRICENMRHMCEYMQIFGYAAYVAQFSFIRFSKCHYMEKNMRYAGFGKICDRTCDHIFVYNQHPYVVYRTAILLYKLTAMPLVSIMLKWGRDITGMLPNSVLSQNCQIIFVIENFDPKMQNLDLKL